MRQAEPAKRRRNGDANKLSPEDRPAHDYTLEQFGLTPERIEREFEAYRQRFIVDQKGSHTGRRRRTVMLSVARSNSSRTRNHTQSTLDSF